MAGRAPAGLAGLSKPSGREDRGCPDPVALLALVLLRSAADPNDARLADLVWVVADAVTDPDTLP